jgi:hypothetical protein
MTADPASPSGLPKRSAQPDHIAIAATYIGLRVNRKGPFVNKYRGVNSTSQPCFAETK